MEDLIKSIIPKLEKNETKHGVEYSLKFKNGSAYDFSFPKGTPYSKEVESFIDNLTSYFKK